LGDSFNILRCVGVVSFDEVLESIEVRVRVIEVMVSISISVGVITLFENCVPRGVVCGS
jgi:hypothetical protein